MAKKGEIKNRLGEKFITKEGYQIEIVKYINSKEVFISFDNGFTVKTRMDLIRKGKILNPLHKTVYNIGFIGIGKYKTKNNSIRNRYYRLWQGILERCYDKNTQIKNPTYVDCSVDERWHNFQNFAQWYEDNYNPETMQDWQLDKDILVKDNKVYSPETCCFVPQKINSLFKNSKKFRGSYPIGVLKLKNTYSSSMQKDNKNIHIGCFTTPEEAFEAYKTEKEKYIKEVADKWKGLISDKVYQAMYNYQVEITD